MQQDLSRYSCQINLPGFGAPTQQLLQKAKVLIVGAGGLGCPAAQYIVAAGVGTVGIADYDVISAGNLHRQILYKSNEVGLKKAEIACQTLRQQNPGINVVMHDTRITDDNVMEVIRRYDLVLDCTDNFDTRYLLNDACVLWGIPLIQGAIYQYEGHVAIWNAPNTDGTRSPNYRDIFPHVNAAQVPNCTEGGVFPTLAGIIGSMMANETLKYIAQAGETLIGKMLVFDALTLQSRIVKTGTVSKVVINGITATTKVNTLSHEQLRANGSNYLLVDVRGKDEHSIFNIGGINIPVEQIAAIKEHLLGKKRIVLYCASGRRSAEGAKAIKTLFNAEVYSLEGGIKEWHK